ncbi:DUF3352 domain-containing protein [Pseudanabaena sp. UWO311]|uniref:DUF3352 domain-containing protein n=1 Tax=Pseudanabaena sp. UWO311 TaxID=2487337 RepID=UPI0011587331|nr:DUF3352 domain-containing protein [Pseudanabaena sp. UWO311]TYQ23594.1 DUF3352 domain-containing protein [Pseudanabaena sp. UWO311]
MKIKPVFVGIAVVGVLLLVLSLSAVGKIFGANPRDVLAGVKTQPLAVKFLPQRSPLFVSFLVNPDKLALFTQLAAKPSDRGDVRHELANLRQQLQQNWLLDYDRDIQPWLDQEITLAVTDVDLDQQPANGLQTGYLLAFAAKDAELAKTSIDAFWQRLAVNGSDLGFEQYQGISILNTSFAEDKPAIAGTTLDKFVLFANDTRVLHKAIDALQKPDLSLMNLENYRDRLAQFNTGKNVGKVGVAYINLAELGEELPKESLLMSLSFDKSGIRAKTALNLASEKLETVVDTQTPKLKTPPKNSGNIANKIPLANSVIIGNNLGETLQGLQNTLLPEWKQSLIKTIAPITLDSSTLAWAQHDYAIALLPKANHDLDWLLVAKVEDANVTKEAIANLDRLVRNKLTVGEISLKAQPVTIWTNLSANDNSGVSGNVVAAHTQTKDYVYLSNSLAVLEASLTLKNSESITASKLFKTISAKLPSDRLTYGYIDKNLDLSWVQTSLLNFKSTSEITQNISNSPLAKPLNHMEVSGFAITSSDKSMHNGELFLILK